MIVGMSMQTFFSIQHALSAACLVRRVQELEKEKIGSDRHEIKTQITANIVGALFFSVAFIEAAINELYAEAVQGERGMLKKLDERALSLISQLFDTADRSSVTSKIDLLLTAAGKAQLDKSKSPSQDVETLIKLRNGLMHYKASWFDAGTEGMTRKGSLRESKLWREMQNKFEFRPDAGGFNTDAWISIGCAKWALTSSIAYVDEVFLKLEIPSIIDHVRDQLIVEVIEVDNHSNNSA